MTTTKTSDKTGLTAATLAFMQELAQNNNRDWFQTNRSRYEAARVEFTGLVARVLQGINQFQPLPNTEAKHCIFRINRDVRFSKDKSPYKVNFAAGLGPGGRNSGRIDFFLQIQPNNESFIGAGMYQPTPGQLAKFRQEIDYNVAELKGIIDAPDFRAYFPEIWGDTMKTAPKGYSADHPDIALLRRRQLFFMHRYSDKDVLKPNFAEEVVKGCQLIKPYCDLLNYLFFDEKDE